MTTDSRQWFIVAVLIGIGWLLYLLAPVITPFVISAGLAYLGDPLVDRLERVRIRRLTFGRTLAVVLVFALISAGLALLLLFVLPLLTDQVKRLALRAPEFLEWVVGTALPWVQNKLGLEALELDREQLIEALKTHWKEASTTVLGMLGSVSRGGQAVFNWMMNLILIPVVTFYLLRDWDKLLEGIRTLIPRQIEPTVSDLSRKIDDVLGAFIRGQLMVMVALGVIYTTGLWLLGLDLSFIIGMSAGLLSVVPYLGALVGVAAAIVAAAFQFQDLWHVLLVLLVFGVGQTLESTLLTPKLVGDRIGLHPVAVIFAVLAGGQLFGFLGILLALPVASALNVLVSWLHERYRDSELYGKDAPQREEA